MIPRVSVITLTRNQERYIEQAIRSVLSQKTTFDFEIIVGIDESEDRTLEIVKQIQQEDDRIRIFEANAEERIYHNGYPTGRANFLKCLNAVRAPYVAMCDGDDYWVDEHHLQHKVDLLNQNLDVVAVASDTWIEKEGNPRNSYMAKKEAWLEVDKKNRLDVLDVASRYYPHTSSWVFRNELIFDDAFKNFPAADFAIYLSLALRGDVLMLDTMSTVYRVHDRGITSDMQRDDPTQHHKELGEMFATIAKNASSSQKLKVAKGFSSVLKLFVAKYWNDSKSLKVFSIWTSLGCRLDLKWWEFPRTYAALLLYYFRCVARGSIRMLLTRHDRK